MEVHVGLFVMLVLLPWILLFSVLLWLRLIFPRHEWIQLAKSVAVTVLYHTLVHVMERLVWFWWWLLVNRLPVSRFKTPPRRPRRWGYQSPPNPLDTPTELRAGGGVLGFRSTPPGLEEDATMAQGEEVAPAQEEQVSALLRSSPLPDPNAPRADSLPLHHRRMSRPQVGYPSPPDG